MCFKHWWLYWKQIRNHLQSHIFGIINFYYNNETFIVVIISDENKFFLTILHLRSQKFTFIFHFYMVKFGWYKNMSAWQNVQYFLALLTSWAWLHVRILNDSYKWMFAFVTLNMKVVQIKYQNDLRYENILALKWHRQIVGNRIWTNNQKFCSLAS